MRSSSRGIARQAPPVYFHDRLRRGRLESLRFITCRRAACGQVFFLCGHCDRGQRYCGANCSWLARRASRRAAGERHQHTAAGRRNHAARQQRYREGQREKVTHQSRAPAPDTAMVRALPATVALSARPTGSEVPAREKARVVVSCAFCGRRGRFIRHETLARAGRPERQRRFRSGDG